MKYHELSELLCALSPEIRASLASDLAESLGSQSTPGNGVPAVSADQEVEFHNPISLIALENAKANEFFYNTIMSLDIDLRKDLPMEWNMVVGVSPEVLKHLGPEIRTVDAETAKEMLEIGLERGRRLIDVCTNLQGFLVFDSIGGGKGSGLGSLILERVSETLKE
tara:strand:- start:880 stop:1377 length:498 start_codon:yes stop_codon:yes gene_type:complete